MSLNSQNKRIKKLFRLVALSPKTRRAFNYFVPSTERRRNKLKELKVNNIQITLDGPQKTHDFRRPLIDGGSTYNSIEGTTVTK